MSRVITSFVAVLFTVGIAAAQQREPTIGDLAGGRITGGRYRLFYESTTTLRKKVADAPLVVAGTLVNPRTNPAGDLTNAVTDLKVDVVVKTHAFLKDARVLTLPRYLPVDDPRNPPRMLLFADVFRGKLDPYRGIPLKSDASIKYLLGAMKLDAKQPGDALAYFVKHLDNEDAEMRNDAFEEVRNTDYSILRKFARQFDPALVEARLRQDNRSVASRALDAFLLGHCGTGRHADFLRRQIDKASKDAGLDLDSLLIGYTLLKPKEGLALLHRNTRDGKRNFRQRHATLKALRFFWRERHEVLPKAEILKAVTAMLDQEDIADLIVEDLRREREEGYLDRILALHDRKGFDIPIIRRSILRFALTFPKNPKAARYTERMRAQDPERVKDAEEELKLEQ